MTYNPKADIAAAFILAAGPHHGSNGISNSSAAGAIAGTPGTAPPHWKITATGLSTQIVGTGNEQGIPYIDVRFFGTSANGSFSIVFETQSVLVSTGDSWTLSCFIRRTAGTMTNLTSQSLTISWVQGGTNSTSTLIPGVPTDTLAISRESTSGDAPAGTRSAFPFFNCNYTPSAAVDVTFRFGNPQFEPHDVAGYPVVSTGARVEPATSTSAVNAPMAISIVDGHFVDNAGNPIQLRGVNMTGYDHVAVQGYDPSDPSGGNGGQDFGPKYQAIKLKGLNCVRFVMNSASWMHYAITDFTTHAVANPDPGSNYRQILSAQVNACLASGLYVILDLHWDAPQSYTPFCQTEMSGAAHATAFWTDMATTWGNTPGVIFELFNEPFLDPARSNMTGTLAQQWSLMMGNSSSAGYSAGGQMTRYTVQNAAGSLGPSQTTVNWTPASYQALITAIRATGATNICLVGSLDFCKDFSSWLQYVPADTLSPPQIGCVWHAYPNDAGGVVIGQPAYNDTDFAPQVYGYLRAIQAAGYPIIATEISDQSANVTYGAPFIKNMLYNYFDPSGWSAVVWRWCPPSVPNPASPPTWFETVSDVNGKETAGLGATYFGWSRQCV